MNDMLAPHGAFPDPAQPYPPAASGPFRPPRWSVAGQSPHASDLAFREVTYRLPLDGEQPVVSRVVVMTGEVIVRKARETVRRELRGTVRRQEIEVERDEPDDDPSITLSDGTARA